MRAWPARIWLWLLLIVVVALPVAATLAIVVSRPLPPFIQRGAEQRLAPELRKSLLDNASAWSDLSWQEEFERELAAAGLAALLLDETGRTAYRSSDWPATALGAGPTTTLSTSQAAATIVVPNESGSALAILIVSPSATSAPNPPWFDTDFWLIPLAQMAALLLIVAAVALFVHRAFLRHLALMVAAMRRIGAGDLEASLPRSRVAEVDDAARSFEAMADALRHSLARESALEQDRRMTIGALVHDLRTPLFSLRGYLEGLATGLADTPEKRVRYLQVCRAKADALERLVANLFEFTLTEYLEEVPRPEPLELGTLLRRTADGLLPQAEAKNVRLMVEGVNDPVLVAGDPILLTRVVENVLDNAVRHTPAGGEVRLSWRMDAGKASFVVVDEGSGIPPDDLPHIFTPFFRGDASRNQRTGGAGLGLATARRLQRAHGGDLVASNAPGRGAVFTGTLPLLASAVAEQPSPVLAREVTANAR